MTTHMPAEVFAPGEFIREEIESRGWTQETLAEVLGKSARLVNEILTARRSITPETASALAEAFGTTAELWLNLESAYQLSKISGDGGTVARRSKLYSKAPVNDMVKRRWIERSADIDVLEQRVADFFGLENIEDAIELIPHAARKSTSYESVHPAVCAWLTMARRLATRVSAVTFSEARLKEALIALRALLGSAIETRRVSAVLAKAGVRLVIVEHLPQSKVDGAAFWLDGAGKQPVVALSLRYDRIDCFWFTLVHELMHIAYGDGLQGKADFAGYDFDLVGHGARTSSAPAGIERERNQQAAAYIVPPQDLDGFIAREGPRFSKRQIVEFATSQGLHPGLVVGQLHYRGALSWAQNRVLLERIRQHVTATAITDGWGYSSRPAS